MTSEDDKKVASEEEDKIPWHQFLVEYPPNSQALISSLVSYKVSGHGVPYYEIEEPEVQLFCTHDSCNGFRFFECVSDRAVLSDTKWKKTFLTYRCKNCETTTKTYAIMAIHKTNDEDGLAYKIGEYPPFGPHTPARVISLIGPDRETFLKGRRSENQGLGVGAFAYYRRVVENQWTRFIDKIIKVSQKLAVSQSTIDQLEAAKKENQFSKAVEDVKDLIPQTLLINGHNPITLLYKALSEGIHAQTDDECLELAKSIRVVLTELAERLGQALKDHAELNDAVSKLLKSKTHNK